MGLTTLSCKNNFVTETATDNLYNSRNGLSECSMGACMNGSGESRKEATGRTMEILNAKTQTRLGFWNVRTMFETGKLAQVTSEMNRYNLHILGVSESRWTGAGRQRTGTGETVLYSGRDDNMHFEGVAIILKKGLEKSLIEWKPVNSRIIKVRLRGRHNNMSIIQCYAPTNDGDEEDKNLFYEQLQAELEEIPRHDVIIVMGDMNAKVGNDNLGVERTMGRHGCGTINNNGERLVDFCADNSMVIGGTLFPHPTTHKLTWISPNGRDRNQIDHIAINGIWRRSLLDVRVRRGADVGSDHHLVTARIRMKLRRTDRQQTGHRRFDVNKLDDPAVKKSFLIQLKNRYQALVEVDDHTNNNVDEINSLWNTVKKSYQETSKEIMGHREKKHKEWISQEAWQKIEERRNIKQKLLGIKSERLKEQQKQVYKEADRTVKQLTRRDKRKYLEDMATQAEEAAHKGDQATLYNITKQVCGQFRKNLDAPIKDKDGKLLISEETQDARWAEYFSEILNRPPPETEPDIPVAVEDLEIETSPPSKEEIINAIKALKNNKAPGPDNLNAELFKTDPAIAAEILLPLMVKVWQDKRIPDDWNEATIIRIPKKGALNDCNNWRGITLLSIRYLVKFLPKLSLID